MKGATRTATLKIANPNGRYNTRSQRFRIPTAHKRTRLSNKLRK
jgi:hypothetical protein